MHTKQNCSIFYSSSIILFPQKNLMMPVSLYCGDSDYPPGLIFFRESFERVVLRIRVRFDSSASHQSSRRLYDIIVGLATGRGWNLTQKILPTGWTRMPQGVFLNTDLEDNARESKTFEAYKKRILPKIWSAYQASKQPTSLVLASSLKSIQQYNSNMMFLCKP